MKLEKILTFIFLALVVQDIVIAKPKTIEKKEEIKEEQEQELIEEQVQEQKIEFNEDDHQELNQGLPIIIEIQYCNKTGLHNQFLEIEKMIYLNYPYNQNLQISTSGYPIPELQKQIASFINYGQYVIMGLMLFSKQIFGMLGMSVPPIVEKLIEKKMFVLGGVIILNSYLQNYLTSTGKMRVFVDSSIVYDQSSPINVSEVIKGIQNELLQYKS